MGTLGRLRLYIFQVHSGLDRSRRYQPPKYLGNEWGRSHLPALITLVESAGL
jgi:hypothetical protein